MKFRAEGFMLYDVQRSDRPVEADSDQVRTFLENTHASILGDKQHIKNFQIKH